LQSGNKAKSKEKSETINEFLSFVGKSDMSSPAIEPSKASTSPQEFKQLVEQFVMKALQQFFRPEFLNRLDDIVIFNPVSREMLTTIVDIQMNRLIDQLSHEKRITLEIRSEVKDFLADK
jgi:ATP-dependent Clp protease ATP-binding subunit ClpA